MEQMYTMNFSQRELEIICEQLSLKPFNEVAHIIGRIQQDFASQQVVQEVAEEEVVEVVEE